MSFLPDPNDIDILHNAYRMKLGKNFVKQREESEIRRQNMVINGKTNETARVNSILDSMIPNRQESPTRAPRREVAARPLKQESYNPRMSEKEQTYTDQTIGYRDRLNHLNERSLSKGFHRGERPDMEWINDKERKDRFPLRKRQDVFVNPTQTEVQFTPRAQGLRHTEWLSNKPIKQERDRTHTAKVSDQQYDVTRHAENYAVVKQRGSQPEIQSTDLRNDAYDYFLDIPHAGVKQYSRANQSSELADYTRDSDFAAMGDGVNPMRQHISTQENRELYYQGTEFRIKPDTPFLWLNKSRTNVVDKTQTNDHFMTQQSDFVIGPESDMNYVTGSDFRTNVRDTYQVTESVSQEEDRKGVNTNLDNEITNLKGSTGRKEMQAGTRITKDEIKPDLRATSSHLSTGNRNTSHHADQLLSTSDRILIDDNSVASRLTGNAVNQTSRTKVDGTITQDMKIPKDVINTLRGTNVVVGTRATIPDVPLNERNSMYDEDRYVQLDKIQPNKKRTVRIQPVAQIID